MHIDMNMTSLQDTKNSNAPLHEASRFNNDWLISFAFIINNRQLRHRLPSCSLMSSSPKAFPLFFQKCAPISQPYPPCIHPHPLAI